MNFQGGMDGQGYPDSHHPSFYPPIPNANDKSRGPYPTLSGYPTVDQKQQYMADPLQNLQGRAVAEAALFYGSKLVGSSKEMVDEKIKKYQSVSTLRHYFSVDTSYVGKKLRLILFPFYHMDWSRKYTDTVPAKPRYDVNSPDLYIPLMGYVTYLLVVGLVLGIQNRFNIEVLAVLASQSVACIFIEIALQLLTLYVTNIQTHLTAVELTAFAGYKFVGIIISALLSLAFYKKGYYTGLIYCSISLAFFMVRTLRLQILSSQYRNNIDLSPTGYPNDPAGYGNNSGFPGPAQTDAYHSSHSVLMTKRQMYFLMFVAISQPLFMWWLSYNLDANELVK